MDEPLPAAPPPEPTGPAADAGSQRDRIIEAAVVLFAQRGFEGVTLRALGEQVGLHNSSLFHHFRGKREIGRAVFDRVIERVVRLLEPLAEDEPPSLETFLGVLGEVADHFAAAPNEARFLLRTILSPDGLAPFYPDGIDRDDLGNPLVRLFSTVWGWLARARASGAIRPVRVYQATRNLFGILLFEPAYGAMGEPEGSFTPEYRLRRREELSRFVRGALAPEDSP